MKKKRKFRAGFIRDILITMLMIGVTTASICAVVFSRYVSEEIKPKADVDIAGIVTNLTSIVYYQDSATGNYYELETLHGEQNRIWADLDEIPDMLKTAFISIEDERFYDHNGVDWKRTLGAAVNWVLPLGGSYGGSTITQQLIKNVTQDNDFKVTRKITEILRAIDLEEKLTKDEILESYLNTIYFGRTAYGVKTAAITYFGKDLDELNLAECAVLAGLTNNPSKYDPFRYPENTKIRQENILYKMYELGEITKAERDEALEYELIYVREVDEEVVTTSQSYFIDALIEAVIEDLMDEKGYSKTVATQLIYSAGYRIYATVDPFIQNTMENVYTNDANFPSITGKNGALPQSAMVVMDPNSGAVLGIVGGRGEKEGDRVLNRATQSKRQPGSAIKPIAVYAPAVDAGLITPITVIDDSPYNFEVYSTGWPTNYYTGYNGLTTVTQGVLNSVNTLAVKTLDMLGTKEAYSFLTANLGVTTLQPDDENIAPLALGGLTQGMTVLETTAAYVPFANEGLYYEPIFYTKIEDANGNVIIEKEIQGEPVFENPNTVYYMRDLLRNVVTSGTGGGTKISGMDTIGKTGTTNDVNDVWFAGSTPYYTAVTWFGYDTPQYISQGSAARTLWSTVMKTIHADLEAKNFTKASSFTSVKFCLDSGLKATDLCALDVRGSRVSTGSISPSDIPEEECNLHVMVPTCTVYDMIATQYCPLDTIEEKTWVDLTRLFENEIYIKDEIYMISFENEPVGEGVPALRYEIIDEFTPVGISLCIEHTEDTYSIYKGWLDYNIFLGLDEEEVPPAMPEDFNIEDYIDEDGNFIDPNAEKIPEDEEFEEDNHNEFDNSDENSDNYEDTNPNEDALVPEEEIVEPEEPEFDGDV